MIQNPNNELSTIFENSEEKISHQAKLLLERIISSIPDDKKEAFIDQLLQDMKNKKDDYFDNSLFKTWVNPELDERDMIKLVASDGKPDTRFGWSVAISSSKIVIGVPYDRTNGIDSGCVYIYDLDGSNEIKITPSDGTFHDYFGWSVAVSNSKIVVGAYNKNANGRNSGCVYIYDLDGTNEIKLTPSDGVADDYFGYSVAVSNTKLVVGAYGKNVNGPNSGCVYIYDLDGSNEIKLTPAKSEAYDFFGFSVAVSDTKIAVGAYGNDTQGPSSGCAYIYELDGSKGIKITASDGVYNDYFGYSVAVSDTKIVVGTPYSRSKGLDSGCAYIYNLYGAGEIKLVASDGAAYDNFGIDVSISDTKIVVGACDKGCAIGSAYIYELDGSNEIKFISPSNIASYFGHSVAATDAEIVIGTYGDRNNNGRDSGCAYIHKLDKVNGIESVVPCNIAYDHCFGQCSTMLGICAYENTILC